MECAGNDEKAGGGLKLVGMLFDRAHDELLNLTEFVTQCCDPGQVYFEEVALKPPFRNVFANFETSLAFHLIRPGLPAYGTMPDQALLEQEGLMGVVAQVVQQHL